MRTWLLPEYIEDILPREALRVEGLRSSLIELFRVHGYQFVITPMLEYVESLLTGTGHDLDLRTFKLVDQLSGRMMGIRADMTPQVARVDAHLLNEEGVTRLCYCGSVLHTRPRGLNATREPLQIGAEIYGHAGIESDIEIQKLLFRALSTCGVEGARLDVGHVGVFRALCRRGGVSTALETALHEALEAKDAPQLIELTCGLSERTREALVALPGLYGDASVLERARKLLPDYEEIAAALGDLEKLACTNDPPVSVDLADLRGYHYHSGVVFSAYAPKVPNAIALGGRYDEVGKAFGRARPATGFSMDLRELVRIAPESRHPGAIRAPRSTDQALEREIEKLRAAGEIVVVDLPGLGGERSMDFEREIALVEGKWQLRKTRG